MGVAGVEALDTERFSIQGTRASLVVLFYTNVPVKIFTLTGQKVSCDFGHSFWPLEATISPHFSALGRSPQGTQR